MKKIYIFFILFLITLSAALAWSIPLGSTEEVLPVTLNVTDTSSRQLGFSVSREEQKELDFGSTFPGTTVIKTLNITRGSQPPAFVSVIPEGTIAPWTEVSDGDFLLNNLNQVKVSVKVPEDAKEGNYGGQIRILYKKTLFSILMG